LTEGQEKTREADSGLGVRKAWDKSVGRLGCLPYCSTDGAIK
jgi:hypothetical protein